MKINNQHEAPVNNFVLFENNGTEINVEATENSILLVLSGEPINEPIFAHGPFLMNSAEEIRQAMHDFGSGKFGHLE